MTYNVFGGTLNLTQSINEAAQVPLFRPVIPLLTVKCYSVDRLIFASETYTEQSLTCSNKAQLNSN